MFKRTVLLLVAAALALPATAAAETIDVNGPLSLRGHGPLRGQLGSADGPARVTIELSGKVVVSGLARDLEVSCTGPARIRMRSRTNRRGLEQVVCLGRRMTVVVSASRFHFGALARQWVLEIPEGVSGKLHGNFRERPKRPAPPPAEDEPADEREAA